MAAADEPGVPQPGDRFIKVAVAILGETGRTDFTVQQVVARAKASLRAFYQQFATKDELLLALSGQIIARSSQAWRDEAEGLTASAALRLLIDRIGATPETDRQHGINQALSLYYEQLAQTRPREFADLLAPLHRLVGDILERGVSEGVVSRELNTEAAAAVVLQTIFGAQRIRALGTELAGMRLNNELLHAFCLHGLSGGS
jgi:AcrR family transcriptional regulator